MDRPEFIGHWKDMEAPDDRHYRGNSELLAIQASVGKKLGLTKIGVHHERLPPGRRTSFPHAESIEEEFVFVVEGSPDVWVDGHLHRLSAGDSVAFPSGTGIAHTFINNSDAEVRLLVIGEANKPGAQIIYPVDPEHAKTRTDIWQDAPKRDLGPHDGKPDRLKD